MKYRFLIPCVAAALTIAPMMAFGADNAAIQRCIDSFAAQSFPDRTVNTVVKEDYLGPTPLVFRTGTQWVDLVATGKTTGHVYATATCNARSGALIVKEGKVIVMPIGR